MMVHFRIRMAVNNPFSSILNPLRSQNPQICQTLEMVTQSGSKRPMCPSCSKPARLCLCTRLKTPSLHNSVRVTILQHSLEKTHPLNSARIATLGLKNLDLVSVSDVNFQAQFTIRLLQPDFELGSVGSEIERTSVDGSSSDCENTSFRCNNGECSLRGHLGCEKIGQECWDGTNLARSSDLLTKNQSSSEAEHGLAAKNSNGDSGKCDLGVTLNPNQSDIGMDEYRLCSNTHENNLLQPFFDPIGLVPKGTDEPAITCTVAKYGVISSFTHQWLQLNPEKNPNLDQILTSPVALNALEKGFVVKKLQRKQLKEGSEWEECEEFVIRVEPGSVLLFPSEKSVGIEALDFDVKNLIVLDGTWAKAKRMYNENPWLKLLPHLKLDVEKMSLYNEVRQQPRAECLSTIESTVYALKAVGDNLEGLDNLLEVFESMVADQRRCKDERLSKLSQV